MGTDYKIDADRQIIFSRAAGKLTGEDLRGHQQRLRSDPGFDRHFDQLWNFLDVEAIDVSTATVRELASARSFDPGARRAFVVSSDFAYGLMRMFQQLHDGAPEELRLFRSLEEAEAWLGLT